MKSTFDKNAEKFVNLMVEKIESLSMNWQKPWFSKVNSKQNFLPQNLTGRTYSGGNAFLLYFLCEKYNYQTPVFLTFNQARNEGINVLKGAVAFPVYYTLFCAYHRQTNEKISYDEYNKLSEEEQKSPTGQGMNLIYKQLMTAFEEMGVTVIEAKGQQFDPELHNAVMHEDNDELEENVVVEEFQKGYKYRDSVIRHSMVKVAN